MKALQTENVELNQEVQRLREQIEKIKHAILTGGHTANGDSSDTVRKSMVSWTVFEEERYVYWNFVKLYQLALPLKEISFYIL